MPDKIIPLTKETFIKTIQNSIGSKTYRNCYAKVNGKKIDIAQNGKLSCAFFVSSLLLTFKMINEIHATVDGTVKDLRASGWREIKKPKIGAIIVWDNKDFGESEYHKHIGFYVGAGKAISNNSTRGFPTKHHWTFHSKRKADIILWNPKLK